MHKIGLAHISVTNNTRMFSWANTNSAGSYRNEALAAKMVYDISSTTGCVVIPCIATNNNDFKWPRAYIWLRILFIDHCLYSTRGLGSLAKMTCASSQMPCIFLVMANL